VLSPFLEEVGVAVGLLEDGAQRIRFERNAFRLDGLGEGGSR